MSPELVAVLGLGVTILVAVLGEVKKDLTDAKRDLTEVKVSIARLEGPQRFIAAR